MYTDGQSYESAKGLLTTCFAIMINKYKHAFWNKSAVLMLLNR